MGSEMCIRDSPKPPIKKLSNGFKKLANNRMKPSPRLKYPSNAFGTLMNMVATNTSAIPSPVSTISYVCLFFMVFPSFCNLVIIILVSVYKKIYNYKK